MEDVVFRVDISIEAAFTAVRSFGAKQNDGWESRGGEDGDKVERPSDTHGLGNLAHNNGSEEGTAKDGKIGKGHADTTLMDKVQVSYGGVQETLVRSNTNALHGAGPGHAPISRVQGCLGRNRIVSCVYSTCPRAAGNDNAQAEKKQMALAPDPAGRDKEDDGGTGTGEQVASKDDGVVEGRGNAALETDGIGCQDGS